MARSDRVAAAIQKEVSSIIHDQIKDPRLGFVTIMRVEVTPDLRCAKIFFSVLGNDEAYAKTQKALNSAVGYIRHLISQRVQLRYAPEIIFKEDRTTEYSVRIQQVLDEIKGKEESNESTPKKARRSTKKKK